MGRFGRSSYYGGGRSYGGGRRRGVEGVSMTQALREYTVTRADIDNLPAVGVRRFIRLLISAYFFVSNAWVTG